MILHKLSAVIANMKIRISKEYAHELAFYLFNTQRFLFLTRLLSQYKCNSFIHLYFFIKR